MSRPFSLLLSAALVASPAIALCANNVPRIVKTVEAHWRTHADGRGWRDPRVEVDVVSAPENEPKCDKPPEVVVVDARYPGRMKLTLKFTLRRGSYATIFVKRITGLAWSDEEDEEETTSEEA